ncbi:M48 family metallopeptidase [Verrucosispora sioxanthis]|uniref:M48 family metallopeptidase n=1 Tax=Verrucosispora sioxanthis TaxID=2499994 RepID=UPI001AA04E84|nr:M48 family metallopeptidase [Verrucosispora sioxanthis]
MNFFERQRQVRRLSTRLVLLFVLAVVGIVVVVNVAALVAFNATTADPGQLAGFIAMVTVATLAAIGLAALVRTLALRGGGGKVARELGGVPVPANTTDPELRRLRNVVEEMALASGVPVPEVYVLPEETAINAFAAGWTPSDAAVAVTRGALQRLNRDELQGVIAHEFSHVVNGDMRLNIRLMGLLFGILFLTVIGRGLARAGVIGGGRSRGNNSGGSAAPLALVGLALLVAGYVGVLAGRLIQASVSRQREYLADASAVQYTRQTRGIAGALKKIGGLSDGSELKSPKRDEVGHMLFGEAARTSWFATHPPLADRIRALEPSFDPAELQQLSRRWAAAAPSGRQEDVAMGLAPAAPGQPGAPGRPAAAGRRRRAGRGRLSPGHPGAASGSASRRKRCWAGWPRRPRAPTPTPQPSSTGSRIHCSTGPATGRRPYRCCSACCSAPSRRSGSTSTPRWPSGTASTWPTLPCARRTTWSNSPPSCGCRWPSWPSRRYATGPTPRWSHCWLPCSR